MTTLTGPGRKSGRSGVGPGGPLAPSWRTSSGSGRRGACTRSTSSVASADALPLTSSGTVPPPAPARPGRPVVIGWIAHARVPTPVHAQPPGSRDHVHPSSLAGLLVGFPRRAHRHGRWCSADAAAGPGLRQPADGDLVRISPPLLVMKPVGARLHARRRTVRFTGDSPAGWCVGGVPNGSSAR
ncbi:hypothetical protein HBB16_12685 [Pseudonocardia sp. MCCB 268]|nr:hypothetical protein [Pseudonocardia cytotoxica]